MNLIIRIIILSLFVFQNSCGGTAANKDYAVNWFKKNEVELNALIKKLLAHPNIMRVEDMTMDYISKYGEFSDADLKVYNEILKISKKLDIKAVVVSRERAIITGDLIGIQFILISGIESTCIQQPNLTTFYSNTTMAAAGTQFTI